MAAYLPHNGPLISLESGSSLPATSLPISPMVLQTQQLGGFQCQTSREVVRLIIISKITISFSILHFVVDGEGPFGVLIRSVGVWRRLVTSMSRRTRVCSVICKSPPSSTRDVQLIGQGIGLSNLSKSTNSRMHQTPRLLALSLLRLPPNFLRPRVNRAQVRRNPPVPLQQDHLPSNQQSDSTLSSAATRNLRPMLSVFDPFPLRSQHTIR
jgi:hypothetical protein